MREEPGALKTSLSSRDEIDFSKSIVNKKEKKKNKKTFKNSQLSENATLGKHWSGTLVRQFFVGEGTGTSIAYADDSR